MIDVKGLRQAMILISNVRTSASKKINRMALIYRICKNERKILWFMANCVIGEAHLLGPYIHSIWLVLIQDTSHGFDCESHSKPGDLSIKLIYLLEFLLDLRYQNLCLLPLYEMMAT